MVFLKTLEILKRRFSRVVYDGSRECFVEDDGNYAKIFLNRPQKLNSIGKILLAQLKECIDHVRADKKVIVFSSKCPKAFCSGADLKERIEMNLEETDEFVSDLRKTFDSIANLDQPTIACIDGIAFGGGLELALACDLRVASKSSRLGLPETKLAIFPAAGGSQRLPLIVGPSKAKELIFCAEILDADGSKAIGLLNQVSEDPSQICDEIVNKILKNGPIGIKMAKKLIDHHATAALESGLQKERELYLELLNTEDRLEGLRSFREKRPPIYKGK